jgi:hypothetical protein
VKLVIGNFKTATAVCLSEALAQAAKTTWRYSVTRFTPLGVATILSTSLVTPALAQAVIQEPGLYAFYHPNGGSRIGLKPRDAVVAGSETANAMALAPAFRPSMAGKEMTTRPWSAPVGHRQPRVADVPISTSGSQSFLDQEDAIVDRKISGICRGC